MTHAARFRIVSLIRRRPLVIGVAVGVTVMVALVNGVRIPATGRLPGIGHHMHRVEQGHAEVRQDTQHG